MKILGILYMAKQKIKRKYVFIGDTDSINIELIVKSFNYLIKKVNYIIICNKFDIINNKLFIRKNLKINEIFDPINFSDFKKNCLNIYNVENQFNKKYLNLLNQIKISNSLSNSTKNDLITMPINKSIFKRNMRFTGMTEYLGKLNKKQTSMLMYGDKFSTIPITTHINPKNIHKHINSNYINSFLKNIFKNLKNRVDIKFNEIKFLCYNPHCGEEGLLGLEDIKIKKIISKFRKIKGLYSADSAFVSIKKNSLFISTYHDQALIPFKIINKESFNLTLGLDYRRLSPSHGTAKDIKHRYIADKTSYLKCLLF